MATAPNKYTLITGAQTSVPGLVYVDANGDMAMPTMPWVLNASGILVPWPVASDGTPQVELSGSIPGTLIQPTPYSGTATSAISSSAIIKTGAGVVGTVSNTTTGTLAVLIYDNTAASGKLLYENSALAAGAVVPLGLPVTNGIYASIGTGTVAISYS